MGGQCVGRTSSPVYVTPRRQVSFDTCLLTAVARDWQEGSTVAAQSPRIYRSRRTAGPSSNQVPRWNWGTPQLCVGNDAARSLFERVIRRNSMDSHRDSQIGRRNRRRVLARAAVLAGEQFFQLPL